MIRKRFQKCTVIERNENTRTKTLKEIKFAKLEKRKIRTKSTIFSFDIIETRGALSDDVVNTLKRFKPIIDYAAGKWKLPRCVRVLLSDTIWPGTTYLGGKFQSDADKGRKPYYDIHINLENLHECDVQFDETENFQVQGILRVFLHECAHFVTRQEAEADSLVKKLLIEYVKQNRLERAHMLQHSFALCQFQ